MSFRIRDARPEESAALRDLHVRASLVWSAYREQLEAHPDAIALPADLIAIGRVRVAADDADRPLGFSVVLPAGPGTHELDGLFVEPDHQRGGGIGRALVEDAAARAAAAGARELTVIQGPETDGFYAKLGFAVVGPAPTRFGPATLRRRALG